MGVGCVARVRVLFPPFPEGYQMHEEAVIRQVTVQGLRQYVGLGQMGNAMPPGLAGGERGGGGFGYPDPTRPAPTTS